MAFRWAGVAEVFDFGPTNSSIYFTFGISIHFYDNGAFEYNVSFALLFIAHLLNVMLPVKKSLLDCQRFSAVSVVFLFIAS